MLPATGTGTDSTTYPCHTDASSAPTTEDNITHPGSSETKMDTSLSPHQYGGMEPLQIPGSPDSPDQASRLSAIHPVLDDSGVERYYCSYCSFCGESRDELLAHVDSHYQHRCELCGYTSRTEGRLKQHTQRFHHFHQTSVAADLDNGDNSQTNCLPTEIDEEASQKSAGKSKQDPVPRPSGSSTRTSSKRRIHRCKQCEFTGDNKTELWRHARGHIKEEKRLDCPRPNCEFVTEFKHHMEYHIRNHFNSKPYKCSKCNYTCVNKSMLNSHKKSHTNIYQYRCADCTYATKYCHSLKLHLLKYSHQPAAILNLDGTVDHDTSGLLVMKKSGPKGSKAKVKRAEPVNGNLPQTTVANQTPHTPSSSMGFPMTRPPASFMPFWNMRGPVGPTPSALLPLNMGNLFRGMFPPSLLPQQMTGNMRMESTTISAPSHTESPAAQGETSHNYSSSQLHPYRADGFEMAGMMGPRMMLPFRPHTMIPNAAVGLPWSEVSSTHGREDLIQQPVSESSQSDENGSRSPPPSALVEAGDSNMEAPLDLTKSAIHTQRTPALNPAKRRLRKGKAIKLDALCLKLQKRADASKNEKTMMNKTKRVNFSPESGELQNVSKGRQNSNGCEAQSGSLSETTEQNNNSIVSRRASPQQEQFSSLNGCIDTQPTMKSLPVADDNGLYNCPYCEVAFKNCIMYTVHMGYHGYSNPFRCNMCGEESDDKVSFFLHIARAAHK